MSGYHGWSMSNNAVAAYEDGEKPVSKWKKSEILDLIEELVDNEELILNCSFAALKKLPAEVLKNMCLYQTSWHHTFKESAGSNGLSADTIQLQTIQRKIS